jgi:hypothetical protein
MKFIAPSLFFVIALFYASPVKPQSSDFDIEYRKFKTERLDDVMNGCVIGRKLNNANISYWGWLLDESRINKIKLSILEQRNVNPKALGTYIKTLTSAHIAVAKEICPDIW